MKNLILTFFLFVGIQNILFSQSKIVMGGGVIISEFKLLNNQITHKPFVGFAYEYNFTKNLFLSTNLNYSKNKINFRLASPLSNEPFHLHESVFVHISGGVLINYKLFSSISKSKFWQGFNTGIGFNIDSFREFNDISQGIINLRTGDHYQYGFLYHLSWSYKKLKLGYNFANGVKMFGNERNSISSADWQTLSASYIYRLD